MFRKFSQILSFGSEVTVRKILEEIIAAGEKKNAQKTYYGKKYEEIPWPHSVNNLDVVVRHFCEALDKALRQNSYSYEMYQKLSESKRTEMRMSIAKHFIEKYNDDLLYYSFNTYPNDDYITSDQYDFDKVYLLPSIFEAGSFYGSGNYCIYKTRKKDANDIQTVLVSEISTALHQYLHKRKYLTLIAGYKDKNSFFSQLPIEVMAMIADNLNRDESNCTSSLKAMK